MSRVACALALFVCLSAPALAQVGVGPGVGGPGYGGGYGSQNGLSPAGVPRTHGGEDDDSKSSKTEKPVEPPPAIPGAQPDADSAVIPADRLAADMSPNDALFDAITRGDLAAAKDALNRGAQLDAHNVLGQTPTDASIDLDRNDITFLLLSMRGAVGGGAGAHGATASATPPSRNGHGRPVGHASAHGRTTTASLSADRGTPNPAVGFIGY
jgi:hypothetical protein